MRQPDFWRRNTPGARAAAAVLAPLGMIYGGSVLWKQRTGKPYRAHVPVICVGNLTVGGTGKTPVAIAIAQALQEKGLSAAFLSRGYGRRDSRPLVVNVNVHDASITGDEALLLARVAPTVVSSNRAEGARMAEVQGTQVIVMDDGHQNFSLHKDISIIVVDGETGFGNGKILPAGPLREPVRQGLRRADAVVVMGDGNSALPGFAGPVLRARIVARRRLNDQPVVAFAGIGRPAKFFDTLRAAGARLVETHGFADHYPYSAAEVAALKNQAVRAKAMLMTTEKDLVRLASHQREGIEVLPVNAVFDDHVALARLLQPLLAPAGAAT
jgi:tetraacyldisaccharide 4'-kinase